MAPALALPELMLVTGQVVAIYVLAASVAAALAGLAFVAVRNFRHRRMNTTQALALAEARYRSIGETTALGVWATDAQGKLVYVSPGFLEYVGLDLPEYVRDGWSRVVVRPADRTMAADSWREALATRSVWALEIEVRGRDGTTRWLLTRGVPVFAEDGTFTGHSGINMDITEHKRVEERLRAANAAKDEFLGLVSHELRTPLTIIAGNAQVLQRVPDIPQADRETSLRDIYQQSERLLRLIENMLVLSRVEAADAVMAEPVLLQRVLPRLGQPRVPGLTQHEVTFDIDPSIGPVAADPTYLEQIVENLISNAEKYSSPGAPIEVIARRDGETASVSVCDRGPGIAQNEIGHIFEPFFRGQATAAQVPGVGLGLSVCKRLADVMGGSMWARSREGGGSEIGLTLRLVDDDAATETGPLDSSVDSTPA